MSKEGLRSPYDLALSFIEAAGYQFKMQPAEEIAGYSISFGGRPGHRVLGLAHEDSRVVMVANDVSPDLQAFVAVHEAAHVALYSEVLGVREASARFHEDVANIVGVRLAGNPFGMDIVIHYNDAVRVADRIVARLQGGSYDVC